MNFKVDLHTHSVISPDGGITALQYQKALDAGLVDAVAVTDHNRIDFAVQLQQSLGERIIVGEEIMTTHGEIIGLYLTRPVQPGLSPMDTVKQIKDQHGLVYIPHPFESVRKGLHPTAMEELSDFIDIVEVCNGRAFFQNKSEQTVVWTRLNNKLGAASSDAHGVRGLGKTYTSMPALPTKANLLKLLSSSVPITDRPGMRSLLYPKYHRLRKKIRRNR